MKRLRWRTKHLKASSIVALTSPRCSDSIILTRLFSTVNRSDRLSEFWTPTGGKRGSEDSRHDATSLLSRAGFFQQSGSGIFHTLPLGLKVQQKVEHLIDKHMRSLNAHKVALSSITSEALWERSGRLRGGISELFRLTGPRGDSGYLLSPTHEEEITEVVKSSVHSYKQLPLKLYQISRKYRNELRPRQGLLRAREFLMKDLYTFDESEEKALETYNEVKDAYYAFFNELKIPYLVAEADSGNMGGNLSHEFHFVSGAGEDNVMSCDSCSYVANEELAVRRATLGEEPDPNAPVMIWQGVARKGRDLVTVIYPAFAENLETSRDSLNFHVLNRAIAELDTTSNNPVSVYTDYNTHDPSSQTSPTLALDRKHYIILDHRVHPSNRHFHTDRHTSLITLAGVQPNTITHDTQTSLPLDLLKITPGSPCPLCKDGQLRVDKAIELGHTFHLGTRYSLPLDAHVSALDATGKEARVPMHMGCHGIGISRLIGAVASILSDENGLNWPRAMAPWDAVVVPTRGLEVEAEKVCDALRGSSGVDAVVDDRAREVGWKLGDADLIGYPVVVVVGKGWKNGRVEVQCRRLGVREEVDESTMPAYVQGLLYRL